MDEERRRRAGQWRSQKVCGGIHDLFNLQFERFNSKVQAMQTIIESALDDPNTRYEMVIAYTGASPLSEPSRRDLEDLKKEMNDTSEVVFTTVLNQSALHGSLVSSASGEPINLQVGIKEWGHKTSPQEAYYGQISGDQIADWWGNTAQDYLPVISGACSARRMSMLK